MLDQETLDELWVSEDAAESELRFHRELEQGGPWDETERQELTTQLARAIALQGRFDEAAALLIELDAESEPVVGVRVLLESGRIMNSSGHPDAAVGLFRHAVEIAASVNAEFLELDALHMLAIVDADGAGDWTARAVELAESSASDRTKRWLVTLHSNYGWRLLEADELDTALAEFVEAARWAELVGTAEQQRWAAEAVEECGAAIAAR
jgi:hypothetical protein